MSIEAINWALTLAPIPCGRRDASSLAIGPHRVYWRPLVLGRMNRVAAASKYPVEVQERAVAMVRELERELGEGRGAIAQVARQLGVHPEALRYWVRRAGNGGAPGRPADREPATAEQTRIAELEKENRELRRANEILRLASAFFAKEMDPRPPR